MNTPTQTPLTDAEEFICVHFRRIDGAAECGGEIRSVSSKFARRLERETATTKPKTPRNRVGSGELVLLDDDRTPTRAGDTVCFNYGIPPIGVRAKVVQRGRSLIALTPGHTPAECNLRTLRRYVGGWVKQNVRHEPRPTE